MYDLQKRENGSFIDFTKCITRFNKNLAQNISDFSIFYDEDLIIDLTAYIFEFCQKNIPNIYGYYEFDYIKFCQTIKYSKTDTDELFRRYKRESSEAYLNNQPVSFKHVPHIVVRERENINLDDIFNIKSHKEKDQGIFSTTKLGNAWYELRYKSFKLTKEKAYINKIGNITELHGKDLNIIEEYYVSYNPQNNTKTYIYFKPNKDIVFNNFKYIALIDITKLSQLNTFDKKAYIYLSSVINELKCNNTEASIAEHREPVSSFCERFNIKRARPTDAKMAVKSYLNNLVHLFSQDENFEVTDDYVTPNSKYRYMIVIKFPKLKRFKKDEIKGIYQLQYHDYYRKVLYDTYIKYHATQQDILEKLTFEQWFADEKIDREYKKNAYIEAQAVIYNNKLSSDSPEVLKEFPPVVKSIDPVKFRESLIDNPEIKKCDKFYTIKLEYSGAANIKVIKINEKLFLTNRHIQLSVTEFKKVNYYREIYFVREENTFYGIFADPSLTLNILASENAITN